MSFLIRIIVGVVLVAAGVAIAIMVPPVLEQSAAESAMIEDLSITSLRSAQIGDTRLVSGRIDAIKNKTFEHELVAGERQKKAGDGWTLVQEYRQPLELMVTAIGPVTITLDSVRITGNLVEVERGDERWIGVKRGQIVTTPCVVSSLSPVACKQVADATIYVGTPDTWRAAAGEASKSLAPKVWAVGGLVGLVGLFVLLTASSARKRD